MLENTKILLFIPQTDIINFFVNCRKILVIFPKFIKYF